MPNGIGTWVDRIWNPIGLSCVKECCARFVAHCRLAELWWWETPQRALVGPGPLFSNRIPDAVIRDLYIVMGLASRHTFKILTRNAERMEQWFGGWEAAEAEARLAAKEVDWPPPNVHLGIVVHDQLTLHERMGSLVASPAAMKFVLIDKAQGEIDLTNVEFPSVYTPGQVRVCAKCKNDVELCQHGHYNALTEGIDQVVMGYHAHPVNGLERNIEEQCWEHGVNFHQIGIM